jgi:hypothetical protein
MPDFFLTKYRYGCLEIRQPFLLQIIFKIFFNYTV